MSRHSARTSIAMARTVPVPGPSAAIRRRSRSQPSNASGAGSSRTAASRSSRLMASPIASGVWSRLRRLRRPSGRLERAQSRSGAEGPRRAAACCPHTCAQPLGQLVREPEIGATVTRGIRRLVAPLQHPERVRERPLVLRDLGRRKEEDLGRDVLRLDLAAAQRLSASPGTLFADGAGMRRLSAATWEAPSAPSSPAVEEEPPVSPSD